MRHLATVAIAAVALASGCTAGTTGSEGTSTPTQRVVQPGAPGQPNQTLTEMPEIPDFVIEEDVTFIQDMLQHHAQAVQMTAWVPERSSRDDVPLFAERIALSQDEEIDLMQNWLRERGEPVLDPTAGHHGAEALMAGMLTQAQLDELEAADGQEFDRLFLRFMYQHHQGAIDMVEELRAADGAQDSFIFRLSKDIDLDQRIEMDRIIEMQEKMGFGDRGTEVGSG